jgi:hypothetical protein
VPDEPAEDAAGEISCLRFRVPDGSQVIRRFWAKNTVQDVLNYLHGQGFQPNEFKVLTTFPRRDVRYIFCFLLQIKLNNYSETCE